MKVGYDWVEGVFILGGILLVSFTVCMFRFIKTNFDAGSIVIHGDQISLKRNNINNGSGDNNNNSNEFRETIPMVDHLSSLEFRQTIEKFIAAKKKTLVREIGGGGDSGGVGNDSGSGGDDDSSGGGGGDDDSGGGDDGGSGDSGGDAGGGRDNDGDGSNDGKDKTKGDGGGSGGGKMGTKMETKGQDDNRNRFSYHGGDENGYLVGQLHRCYYEKPNVRSIIPYQVLV